MCVCAVSLNVHIDGYAAIHRSHLHRRIHRNDVTHATAHTVRLLFIDPFLLFFSPHNERKRSVSGEREEGEGIKTGSLVSLQFSKFTNSSK